MNEDSPLVLRLIWGFARFWWDFLVGDTPEIFVAVLVIVGAIALLSEGGHFNASAVVVLPVLAVLTLAASLLRATRSSRRE
jgi:hypothetical protein